MMSPNKQPWWPLIWQRDHCNYRAAKWQQLAMSLVKPQLKRCVPARCLLYLFCGCFGTISLHCVLPQWEQGLNCTVQEKTIASHNKNSQAFHIAVQHSSLPLPLLQKCTYSVMIWTSLYWLVFYIGSICVQPHRHIISSIHRRSK